MKKSPEQHLIDMIKLAQGACINDTILHVTKSFKDAPEQLGLVATFITLPDEHVQALHDRLDETVQAFLVEHGYAK